MQSTVFGTGIHIWKKAPDDRKYLPAGAEYIHLNEESIDSAQTAEREKYGPDMPHNHIAGERSLTAAVV